jgi:hypothetical protein
MVGGVAGLVVSQRGSQGTRGKGTRGQMVLLQRGQLQRSMLGSCTPLHMKQGTTSRGHGPP